MSKSYVPVRLTKLVTKQAKNRCGYCLSQQRISGMKLEIEHIHPESLGGLTEEENLWLACTDCNSFKSKRIQAVDPNTNTSVALFNPRTQKWSEHFEWIEDGLLVDGKTPTGRATVIALQLNREVLVTARQFWIDGGWHPPKDD
jgi:HNH endonuclease